MLKDAFKFIGVLCAGFLSGHIGYFVGSFATKKAVFQMPLSMYILCCTAFFFYAFFIYKPKNPDGDLVASKLNIYPKGLVWEFMRQNGRNAELVARWRRDNHPDVNVVLLWEAKNEMYAIWTFPERIGHWRHDVDVTGADPLAIVQELSNACWQTPPEIIEKVRLRKS